MSLVETSLRALRAQCIAMLAVLETALGPVATDAPVPGGPCAHPATARTSVATMGNPDEWLCGICGAIYSGRPSVIGETDSKEEMPCRSA